MTEMNKIREILHGFAVESRHLNTMLNIIASDMIRDRELVKKLDSDPGFFITTYNLPEEELAAMRERNLLKLYYLGLHPFLLVRFAGMVGILEYWQALGAPGRRYEEQNAAQKTLSGK
ncbi:MAG: hypothetical protein EXR28_09930 [Betaproteobacteria bacterium]|nr:hypothetical protein [Betaproteobacteria bacterium]